MEVDDKLAASMFGILIQYENDLHHPPSRDSITRRLAWIKRVQTEIEIALDASMSSFFNKDN